MDHTATVYLLDDKGVAGGRPSTYQEDPAIALAKLKRLVGIALS